MNTPADAPDGLAGELAAGLAEHALTYRAVGLHRTIIVCSCGDKLLPELSSVVATPEHHRAHQVVALLPVTQAAITSALGEAAAAIEAVFADPERIRPLAADAEFPTDLANDAEWAAAIVRDLAERGAK